MQGVLRFAQNDGKDKDKDKDKNKNKNNSNSNSNSNSKSNSNSNSKSKSELATLMTNREIEAMLSEAVSVAGTRVE